MVAQIKDQDVDGAKTGLGGLKITAPTTPRRTTAAAEGRPEIDQVQDQLRARIHVFGSPVLSGKIAVDLSTLEQRRKAEAVKPLKFGSVTTTVGERWATLKVEAAKTEGEPQQLETAKRALADFEKGPGKKLIEADRMIQQGISYNARAAETPRAVVTGAVGKLEALVAEPADLVAARAEEAAKLKAFNGAVRKQNAAFSDKRPGGYAALVSAHDAALEGRDKGTALVTRDQREAIVDSFNERIDELQTNINEFNAKKVVDIFAVQKLTELKKIYHEARDDFKKAKTVGDAAEVLKGLETDGKYYDKMKGIKVDEAKLKAFLLERVSIDGKQIQRMDVLYQNGAKPLVTLSEGRLKTTTTDFQKIIDDFTTSSDQTVSDAKALVVAKKAVIEAMTVAPKEAFEKVQGRVKELEDVRLTTIKSAIAGFDKTIDSLAAGGNINSFRVDSRNIASNDKERKELAEVKAAQAYKLALGASRKTLDNVDADPSQVAAIPELRAAFNNSGILKSYKTSLDGVMEKLVAGKDAIIDPTLKTYVMTYFKDKKAIETVAFNYTDKETVDGYKKTIKSLEALGLKGKDKEYLDLLKMFIPSEKHSGSMIKTGELTIHSEMAEMAGHVKKFPIQNESLTGVYASFITETKNAKSKVGPKDIIKDLKTINVKELTPDDKALYEMLMQTNKDLLPTKNGMLAKGFQPNTSVIYYSPVEAMKQDGFLKAWAKDGPPDGEVSLGRGVGPKELAGNLEQAGTDINKMRAALQKEVGSVTVQGGGRSRFDWERTIVNTLIWNVAAPKVLDQAFGAGTYRKLLEPILTPFDKATDWLGDRFGGDVGKFFTNLIRLRKGAPQLTKPGDAPFDFTNPPAGGGGLPLGGTAGTSALGQVAATIPTPMTPPPTSLPLGEAPFSSGGALGGGLLGGGGAFGGGALGGGNP